ncbi:MAG: cytochrome c3 family protein [Bacteroidota bacterium]|nr:cytochrome c3 family protein [Bacteroidota bacterium]
MKTASATFTALSFSAIVFILSMGAARHAPRRSEGMTFSHAVHRRLVECSSCHPAASSRTAKDNLLPTPAACTPCHEREDVRTFWGLSSADSLEAASLVAKDHGLLFSHAAHTSSGMRCEQCHAGVLDGNARAFPSMADCIACHNAGLLGRPPREGGETVFTVGAQCESCHETTAGLVPADHRSPSFVRLHGRKAAGSEETRSCAMCHTPVSCQECHVPMNDVPLGRAPDKDFVDSWPRGEEIPGGDYLTVQKAHSLSYRYTHGLDARARSVRCERCHDEQMFCVPCHRNGYDAVGTRIVPMSHRLAGFVQLGGPRSMNRHGRLAESDIASCAVCHDVDGGDPVCAICHATGAVRGAGR